MLMLVFSINTAVIGQKTDENPLLGTQYAILIKDINTGEELLSRNSNQLMIPASVFKLVTTATSLETFGADYRFFTTFYTDGEILNGVLYGNVIIVGGGDGTLGSSWFKSTSPAEVISKVKMEFNQLGIKSVKGSILLDESYIPEPRFPAGRLWEDMANYYGAAPAAISWRDNTFELDLRSPDKPGSTCEVLDVRPVLSDISFVSFVKAATHNKDSAYIFGYPGLNKWEIRGSIPAARKTFTIKGALPYPGRQFGYEIRDIFLNSNEIDVHTIDDDNKVISNKKELFRLLSPPQSEIIAVINQRSHNLLADHLFLSLNQNAMSHMSNWDEAAENLIRFWQLRNIQSPIRVKDGSGLSPKNLVTASFMVELLLYMHRSLNADVYRRSMAISGQSGTLLRMWNTSDRGGRVVAKSGFMEGVLAYAGYIKTSSGKELAFCVMVNHFTSPVTDVRQLIEQEIGKIIDLY